MCKDLDNFVFMVIRKKSVGQCNLVHIKSLGSPIVSTTSISSLNKFQKYCRLIIM